MIKKLKPIGGANGIYPLTKCVWSNREVNKHIEMSHKVSGIARIGLFDPLVNTVESAHFAICMDAKVMRVL